MPARGRIHPRSNLDILKDRAMRAWPSILYSPTALDPFLSDVQRVFPFPGTAAEQNRIAACACAGTSPDEPGGGERDGDFGERRRVRILGE